MNSSLIILCLALTCPLALNGCGHKGKLKTPTQAEAWEAKKKNKQSKNAAKASEDAADANTLPPLPPITN